MQLEEKALQKHASLKHSGNAATSREELSQRLDDVISFDRVSVWREQARYERNRTQSTVAPHGKTPTVNWNERPAGIAAIFSLAVMIFLAVLHSNIMETEQQRRCLAMVWLLSVLWATEVIPLYVTSMLVPGLTVIMKVLPDPDHQDRSMAPPEAAKRVFSVRSPLPFSCQC